MTTTNYHSAIKNYDGWLTLDYLRRAPTYSSDEWLSTIEIMLNIIDKSSTPIFKRTTLDYDNDY